ncbi:EcoAI/FtnUII family type I restriction enzme subunit R [Endozoicomonas numazuensis]|uniref:Restriction endonuclease subunit R n=1 Tax=Endozoicomonas numazuensis TaxID=1137799 RepID=A0A081NM77_9GAMM|nr:DEAD/DEAH box helicase family protein [Endozoicomonas numazuensis]KEQ19550.1 restriction endonuclease subunit R [Endozoicomonas numazuensis]
MNTAGKRNEADTRAELIDPKLKAAGWSVVEQSYIRREVICPGIILTGGKRGPAVTSDYVLVYRGRKLAAVEAKKEGLSYTEGVRQAKDYATRLQCRIAYATNGHEIYQIDRQTGEEALVDDFLSPEALWLLTFADQDNGAPDYKAVWRNRFSAIPFEIKGDWQPRYYQENAINNALEAIAEGKQRILLTLATGTGKTCIAFQIAWTLFQGRWSLSTQKAPDASTRRPRILFLADRNVLANQAFNDFSAFGDDAIVRIAPDAIKKHGKVPKNASVFFTIFQTFMSGKDEDGNDAPYFGDYPADFFDFIVIDECHRGGANDESSWREILNYFSPAVQLGLTATPKRTENADTYGYFGEPVYSYTLKEGINDGFLTPFKVYPIVGTMDEYIYTPGDGVLVQGKPEPGKLYKEGDFNRTIIIPAREQRRVKYWMDKINPHQKTIVFCATQSHAGMVRDFINQYAVKKGWTTNTSYCVRVTANDGTAGENDLKTFSDNEKTIPTILTTSKKLSTGVDARNVRNIVLMRPCNNMIEFKQIIGRGTRVFEGKEFFTIYDFVKAHHNFSDPEWDGEPIAPEPCKVCSESPCICVPEPCGECGFHPCACPEPNCPECGQQPCACPEPNCPECGQQPCACPRPNCPECGQRPCVCGPKVCEVCGDSPCSCETPPPPEKIIIKLHDGKARQIKHISSVMYWGPDGKPITAKEFVERMFEDLPRFFTNEDQLREIWGDPDTREKLRQDLTEAGYDDEKLDSMKELIDARDSDVYDVLAYVAYAAEVHTRKERAEKAKPLIYSAFTDEKQQEFINFVLDKYVQDDVDELSKSKMRSMVELKYNTISDAAEVLGSPAVIGKTFMGFQKYLYQTDTLS